MLDNHAQVLAIVFGAWMACAMSVAPRSAAADTERERPWAVGVTAEQQDRARSLHRSGNEHLRQAEFDAALALYKNAIAEWDHPSIRLNMAVVMLKKQWLVESYENLLAALRYGQGPLDPEEYKLALAYKAELEQSVARLEVVCDELGARVTLDGKLLFIGPDKLEIWVYVGDHLVVGQRPDQRTVSQSVVVKAHRKNRVTLTGWPIETERVLVSRWPTWMPWLATGAGAALVLAGLPLEWRARSNLASFEQAIAECDMDRCPLTPTMQGMYDSSLRLNRAALSAFATGGVLLVTALTLVVLNRPREKTVPRVVIAPAVSEDRALVSGTLRF